VLKKNTSIHRTYVNGSVWSSSGSERNRVIFQRVAALKLKDTSS